MHSFDTNDATFHQAVVESSKERPVLVDFWADWCAPCRALKPVLERLAGEFGGRFVLAKVDADRNPETTGRYGIRSLPTVMAFRDGAVVDEFMGAQPEAAVREFLARILPGPADIARREGLALLEAGQVDEALARLQAALELAPRDDAIRLDVAEALRIGGRLDAARETLEGISPLAERQPALAQALARLRISLAAAGGPDAGELRRRVTSNPDDLTSRLALARQLSATHAFEEALDEYLEVLRRDRTFGDDAGRRGMLQVFDLLGAGNPLVGRYRRLLASALN